MNKQELLTNGRCKKKADRETVWPVVIMNFTGVYAHEVFARNNQFIWLDCRHLSGTRGYCDKEGIRKLKRVIAGYPAEGIHFIDSGNYHYLTKLWTDKLRVPFSLIVFDHHPDMQPPLFKGMLSCGSWVTDWDQGSFSLQELEELLAIVLRKERVVGIDICGECSATLTLFEERREATVDSRANKELLKLIQSFSCFL